MKRFLLIPLFLATILICEQPVEAASQSEELVAELVKTFSENHATESSAKWSVSWDGKMVFDVDTQKNVVFRPNAWEQHSENAITFVLDPFLSDSFLSASGTLSFGTDAYGNPESSTLWGDIRNIGVVLNENTSPMISSVVESIGEYTRFFERDFVAIRPDDYRFLNTFFSKMGENEMGMNFEAQSGVLENTIRNPSLQGVRMFEALLSTGILSTEKTRDGFRVTLSENVSEVSTKDLIGIIHFFGHDSESILTNIEMLLNEDREAISLLADSSRLQIDFIRGEKGIRFINTLFTFSPDTLSSEPNITLSLSGNTRIEQTSPEVLLPDFSRAIRLEKLLKILEIFPPDEEYSSFEDVSDANADGQVSEFATCLTDAGAVFYGTGWCSHCNNQKVLFGSAMENVNYIDCDEHSDTCQAEEIAGYPTWKFRDGFVLTGAQPLSVLAEKTGCTL